METSPKKICFQRYSLNIIYKKQILGTAWMSIGKWIFTLVRILQEWNAWFQNLINCRNACKVTWKQDSQTHWGMRPVLLPRSHRMGAPRKQSCEHVLTLFLNANATNTWHLKQGSRSMLQGRGKISSHLKKNGELKEDNLIKRKTSGSWCVRESNYPTE